MLRVVSLIRVQGQNMSGVLSGGYPPEPLEESIWVRVVSIYLTPGRYNDYMEYNHTCFPNIPSTSSCLQRRADFKKMYLFRDFIYF